MVSLDNLPIQTTKVCGTLTLISKNGFDQLGIDNISSPTLGGGLRSNIFGAFDPVVSPNPNL
jgi:hypothetical protein